LQKLPSNKTRALEAGASKVNKTGGPGEWICSIKLPIFLWQPLTELTFTERSIVGLLNKMSMLAVHCRVFIIDIYVLETLCGYQSCFNKVGHLLVCKQS
jgi:hypothetical protein